MGAIVSSADDIPILSARRPSLCSVQCGGQPRAPTLPRLLTRRRWPSPPDPSHVDAGKHRAPRSPAPREEKLVLAFRVCTAGDGTFLLASPWSRGISPQALSRPQQTVTSVYFFAPHLTLRPRPDIGLWCWPIFLLLPPRVSPRGVCPLSMVHSTIWRVGGPVVTDACTCRSPAGPDGGAMS